MTAIVAGQGLGLINTSLGLLGEQGQLGVAGQGRSGEKVAVNAATGNLVIQQQDEWLVGIGGDLVAQRTYNSLASGDDDNGDNWRLGYSRRIVGSSGAPTVTRVAEDGLRQTFTQVAANTYQCKQGSGSYDTLVWNGSTTWTWTDGDSQTKEVYQVQYGSSDYLLTSITDLDGLSVTLTYDATTRLITQIKDSNNEYIKVEYDTATKKNITALSTYTSVNAQITQAKRVTYTYDTNTPQQRLQRVVVDLTPGDAGDSQTYATEYSYDGNSNRIKTLKQGTLAQLLANQYNSLLSFDYVDVNGSMRIWKVTESVSGQPLTTQFSYDTVAGTTTVTDANSNQTVLSYDVSVASVGTPKEGALLSIKQPVVNGADLTTRFTYDANGNVETVTDASGNQITYGYDANGNRTYERDGRGNVVERTFSSKNQLLTQTGYTVPAGTGLPSGATTSRYVYDTDANGGHLRFAISPLGNVTEYVYFTGGNGKGQLQYSRQYANTYSLGSMDKAVTPTLTNMTDWVASSAVDKTQKTLVEYAYDFRGQLSKQIAYNKTNASGASLTDDNLQVVTQYFYDQAGNLLKKIDSRADEALTRNTDWARNLRKDLGILDGQQNGKLAESLSTSEKNTIAQYAAYTTTYTYDGLNRITKQTDAQVDGQKGTITTVSVYDDTVRSTTVYKTGSSDANSKLIEVATSVSTYDEAGHLLSLAYTNNKNQQAMGTTKYTYDKLNRLISVEVPATLPSSGGEKSYYLYDEASRKIGEVNAEGALIEYRYNKNGQVSRTIAYDTLVNMGDTTLVGKLAGGTAKLSDLGVDTDGVDKNTWYVYDKAGRLLFSLSSSDSVIGDGSEVLRVHEYVYDGLGRLVSDIAHMNVISGTKLNQLKAFTGELSFDASVKRIYMGSAYISVPTVADDRVTRYYYDADSRRIGELDAQNYYTKSEYDARGRLIARTRYATAVASVPSEGAVPTVVTAETAYTALGQDQVSKYVYNNKGQLTGQLERSHRYDSGNTYLGLGYLYTAYEYDGAGNRTKETRYETVQVNTFDGTTAPTTSANDRVTTYTYDANNRLLSANTTPSGHKIAYAYDAAGNLASTTTTVHRGDGGSDDVRVRRLRYDALGRLTDELSAEGAKALGGVSGEANIQAVWDKYATKYVYNDAGRRIAMIEPNGKDGLGNQTVYYYDKVGRVTHTVNALGEVTQYVYDAFGQKTQVIQHSNRAGTPSALKGGLNSLFTNPASSGASTQTDYSYTRAGELSTSLKAGKNGYSPSDARFYYYNSWGNLFEMDTTISGTKDLYTVYNYDKRGLRTSTDEQLHTLTTTTINGVDTVTETTESLRLTQTAYDAFGRAISTTDGQDVKTETSYDTLGRVVQLKVPSGTGSAATTYTYDAFGRTLGSKDRSGQTTSYAYDDVLGEITVLTPEAGLIYTSVNSAGQTVSTTDARGNTVTYSYDKDGRLTETRVLDTNGSTVLSRTQTRYDMAGRVKEVEDSRGTITSLTYDKAGRVLSRTVDSASGGLALTTLYRYDAKGQAVWTRDANGTWTTTTYSKKGDVLTVVTDPAKIPSGTVAANEDKTGDDLSLDANLIDNPASGGALALETAYTYNAKGQTLTVTQRKSGDAAALLKTKYTYDALGRRDSETVDPGGKNLTTTYEYDKNNRVTKKTDAEQQVTRYVYDEEGRQRFMVDGNGALTQYTYDINGSLSQTYRFGALIVGGAAMSDAQIADAAAANANPSVDQVTTHIYDKMGRLKYVRDALGNLTQYDCDRNGNVIKTTRYGKQASPAPTVDTAKSVGLLKTYTIALGTLADATKDQVTRNYYDAANRLTWTLQYDYDASANPTQKVFAQYYQYDAGGNLVATRRFANAVQNTPTAGTAPQIIAQGADAPSSSVCYVRQDDSNDPIVYKSYDKANRLKFVVDGEGYVTQNDYDNLGNLKSSIRFANAATFGSGFAAGNEVSVLDVGAATTGLRCWVFRDQTGQVNRDRVDNYGYDNAGRLQTQSTTYRNGATVSASKKVYDAAGHVTDVTDAYGTGQDVTTHYNYDTAGRLIEEIKAQDTSAQATTRYVLDELGQRNGIIDPRGVDAAEGTSDWAKVERARILGEQAADWSSALVKGSDNYNTVIAAYTTTQQFDAQGRVTQSKGPLGGTTYTDYDAFGNAIRIKDPNGNYGYFVFNQLNQSTWAIDPMGYATRTEYDALGQVSKITKYGSAVQNLAAIWSASSNSTQAPTFYVDQAAYTAANGSTQPTFAYLIGSPDVMSGETVESPGKDAVTKIEHDLLGRQTKITDAEQYVEKMTYDAFGNKLTYTNKLNGLFSYSYDRVGHLTQEILPEKSSQPSGAADVKNVYSYDARGNRVKSIEAYGLHEERTTTYSYDLMDRLISTEGMQSTYGRWRPHKSGWEGDYVEIQGQPGTSNVYDRAGNLIETVTADLTFTHYYYDALNRKIAELIPTTSNASVNQTYSLTIYEYDAAGNVVAKTTTGMSCPSAQDRFSWSWLLNTSNGGAKTFYEYDANNRLTATTVASMDVGQINPTYGNYEIHNQGLTTRNQYDANGNLIKVSRDQFGANGDLLVDTDDRANIAWSFYDKNNNLRVQVDAERYVTYYASYDGSGNVTSQTLFSSKLPNTFTLSKNSDWQQLVAAVPTSTDDRKTNYVRDRLGRVKQEIHYSVDYADTWTTPDSIQEQTGKQLTTKFDYNGLNAITSKTEASGEVIARSYDKQGRLKSSTGADYKNQDGVTVHQTTVYDYNGLGKVTQVTEGGDHVSYISYDANGFVISEKNAVGVGINYRRDLRGNATTKSINRLDADGKAYTDTTVYQYDASNRVIGEYTFTLDGADAALPMEPTPTDAKNTAYDSHGNVIQKTRFGGIVQRAVYDAAGRLVLATGPDGVPKVYVYDALGNITMTLTPPPNEHVAAKDSVAAKLFNSTLPLTVEQIQSLIDLGAHVSVATFDKRGLQTDTYELANKPILTNTTGALVSAGTTPGTDIAAVVSNMDRSRVSIANENGSMSIGRTVWWKWTSHVWYVPKVHVRWYGTWVDYEEHVSYDYSITKVEYFGDVTVFNASAGDEYRININAGAGYAPVDGGGGQMASTDYSLSMSGASGSLTKHFEFTQYGVNNANADYDYGSTTGNSFTLNIAKVLSPSNPNNVVDIAKFGGRWAGMWFEGTNIHYADSDSPYGLGQVTYTQVDGVGQKALAFNNLPPLANKILLLYRVQAPDFNSDLAWSSVQLSAIDGVAQISSNAMSLAALQGFQNKSGYVEYRIIVVGPDDGSSLSSPDKIRTVMSGYVSAQYSNSAYSFLQTYPVAAANLGAGMAFLGPKASNGLNATINIVHPVGVPTGSRGLSAKLRYRAAGTSTWTPASAALVPNQFSGTAVSDWFSFDPFSYSMTAAGQRYEYLLDVYDAASGTGNVLYTLAGAFTYSAQGSKVEQPVFIQDRLSTAHFFNVDLSATSATVTYTSRDFTGTRTATLTSLGDGRFDWDASVEAGAAPGGLAILDYTFEAKNANDVTVTTSSGRISLGAGADKDFPVNIKSLASASVYTKTSSTSVVLTAPARQAGQIWSIKLFYKAAGTQTYSSKTATVVLNNDNTGTYTFDLADALPSSATSQAFDVYYEFYDGVNQPIVTVPNSDFGAPTLAKPVLLNVYVQKTFSGALSGVDFVIVGVTDPVATSHRRQHFNAFGQVDQDFDAMAIDRIRAKETSLGRSLTPTELDTYATTLKYNTMGWLVDKTTPKTHATEESGFVLGDLEDFRAKTHFLYDGQGRLVRETDANGNKTDYQLLAAGEGKRVVVKETRADAGYTKYDYDKYGDLRRTTIKNNVYDIKSQQATAADIVTDYKYDSNHRVIRVDRPGETGNRATDFYTYDSQNNRISHTTSPTVSPTDSQATSFPATYTTYDALHPQGVLHTSTIYTDKTYFDGMGRVIGTKSATGLTTTTQYETNRGSYPNENWDHIFKTDENGYTSEVWVDAAGHELWKTDLGGVQYNLTYNLAGKLIWQGWVGGTHRAEGDQNVSYYYFGDGTLKTITDATLGMSSYYEYDKNGNKTFEGYSTSNGLTVYQRSNVKYDELNRVVSIADQNYNVFYEYDKVGNRRYVKSIKQGLNQGANSGSAVNSTPQEYWYAYDTVNRMVCSMGVLTGGRATQAGQAGRISQGSSGSGVLLQYDLAGNRVAAKYANNDSQEWYTYSRDGHLTTTQNLKTQAVMAKRTNDLLGRTTTYEQYSTVNGTLTQLYEYDGDNRVTKTTSTDNKGQTVTDNSYETLTGTNAPASRKVALLQTSKSVNTPAGKTSAEAQTTWTRYTYKLFDNAQQAEIRINGSSPTIDPAWGRWATGVSKFEFDANGHVSKMQDSADGGDVNVRSIRYINNSQGLILNRVETGLLATNYFQSYYYLDGRRVGEFGNNTAATSVNYSDALATPTNGNPKERYKNIAPLTSNFDQNYQPINQSYPAMAGSSYVVQSGESLDTIARSVWGDATLWYLIADANNLFTKDVTAGRSIVIPNKVTNIHNTSQTFKVYNPGEAMGDVSPTLPDAPQPPSHPDCGSTGMILMIVVAVVATVLTAGAAMAVLGPGLAAGTSVWAAGTAALASSFASGTAFAAAAIGGAMGSVASQLVGMATGNVQQFSWSAVATGAVSSVVGGALPGGGSWYSSAAKAAAGSVITQQVSRGLGLQKGKFSWSSVAAAAASGAASYGMGAAMNEVGVNFGGDFANKLGYGTAQGIAGGWASAMARHDKPDWSAIAASSFGSALGDAVVGSIVGGDQKKAPQKQEPEYQSKPLTQADIDGFLSGLDDIPGVSPSPGAVRDSKGMTFSENAKYRGALRSQGIDPDAPVTDAPVTQGIQGKYVKVKSGDTVSGLMGSSSPQAVGAFLAGNDMTNSNLRAGQLVFVPDDVNAFGSQARLGQSTLNSDNRRLALAAEASTAQQQAGLDALQVGAWSGRTGDGVPVFHNGAAPISGLRVVADSRPSQVVAAALGGEFAGLDYTLPADVASGSAGPASKVAQPIAGFLTSNHEIKAGFAVYAGAGFNAEITLQTNLTNLRSTSVSEFEAGLGLGVGFKGLLSVRPLDEKGFAANLPVGAYDPFGSGQANRTGAISTKAGVEMALPFVTLVGAEAKVGLQSSLNGAAKVPAGFVDGKLLEVKLSPALQVGASAKWDVFNTSYKYAPRK